MHLFMELFLNSANEDMENCTKHYVKTSNRFFFIELSTSARHKKRGNRQPYHAAPTTDREMARPIPRLAHINGEVSVKNLQQKS